MTIRLMQGNEACAEAALAAGCRFFAGYPITPSTEIAEILAARLPRVGGRFIQMEDEIASMAAIIGASLTGAKTMTATSGPGFSLKQENIGFAALTEVPTVVVNVQRVGPSTGMPTSPAQGDIMQSRWGSHGDRPAVALAPGSVEETFWATIRAFNIAESLRMPVVVLLDEIIGHMRERTVLPSQEEIEVVERPAPVGKPYLPYDPGDGDIPPMAAFGQGYRFHVTGLMHDEKGFPTGDSLKVKALVDRLMAKVERRREELTWVEEVNTEDAELLVVSYGSSARAAMGAVRQAREEGIRAGLLRLVTIWPFPDDRIKQLTARADRVLVPEMNMGQVLHEVDRAAAGQARVEGMHLADGRLFSPRDILDRVKEVVSHG